MDEVSEKEAEEILEHARMILENRERPGEEASDLENKAEEPGYELESGGDNVSELAKELRDIMESMDERNIHDEPEMTPESEREARERGPREEEYSPDRE